MGYQILQRGIIVILMGNGATQGGSSMAQTGVEIPKSKMVAYHYPRESLPTNLPEVTQTGVIPSGAGIQAESRLVGMPQEIALPSVWDTKRLTKNLSSKLPADELAKNIAFLDPKLAIKPLTPDQVLKAKEESESAMNDQNLSMDGPRIKAAMISQPEIVSSDKIRADGTMKGKGFLGELPAAGGKVSTEVSVGVDFGNGEEQIPTLVPTLTQEEIQFITNGGDPRENKEIMRKAIDHAKGRKGEGKNPFAEDSESPSPAAPVSQSNWNQTIYQGDRLTARPSKYNIAAKNTPYVGTAQTPDGKQVPITTIATAQPDGKLMVKVDKQGNILAFGDAHDTGSDVKSNESGKARAKGRGGKVLPTIDIFQAGRTGLPEDAAALARANSEESASWRTATPEEIKTVKQTLSV